jgi:hypothetical protein
MSMKAPEFSDPRCECANFAADLQEVSDQLEASKLAPQMVLSNH